MTYSPSNETNTEAAAAPERFGWATYAISSSGAQLIHIYRVFSGGAKAEPVLLDAPQSTLLNACLHQLAQDTSITWANARQDVLRGFYKTLISATRSK